MPHQDPAHSRVITALSRDAQVPCSSLVLWSFVVAFACLTAGLLNAA